MYTWVEYKEEHREQWNQFVQLHGTVFHRIEWKEVLEETFGYRGYYRMLMDSSGTLVGLLPLLGGRDLRMKKAGISIPFVNYLDLCCADEAACRFMIEQMHPLLCSLQLDYIELRLKDRQLQEDGAVLNDHNYTFLLPLEGDEEKVLALSKSDNRNHVRKTYKNNWFSVSFAPENLKEYYRVYCKTMKRLGSPAPSYKFFSSFMEKLGSAVTLLTVLDNESGKIIGGMFLFTSGDTVYYPWGGALPEFNKKYVNNFMYWEAAKFGIKNGYKYLDLGRSPLHAGTYKFKQQWGAAPVPLRYYRYSKSSGGTKAVSAEDVGAAVSLWKKLPDFVTDPVGKRLIKFVMP